jgi:1-acyl-sn-glycerol-3-phosphate acyltransferase
MDSITPKAVKLPVTDRRILGGFHWFIPRYMRKHFHALAVQASRLETAKLSPMDAIVVYANHASWWDPLVAMFVGKRLLKDFQFYAPIDAEALKKYRIFEKLGFFPVQQHSREGAKKFLKVAQDILSQPGSSIWITPEGRFTDARDHSADFMPGLAHLATSLSTKNSERTAADWLPRLWFVPTAIEYTFWEERLPEILVSFGDPILVRDRGPSINKEITKQEWNQLLSDALRSTQQQLAERIIARDSTAFDVILSGATGTWRMYDLWRWCCSKITGKQIDLQHGDKLRGR